MIPDYEDEMACLMINGLTALMTTVNAISNNRIRAHIINDLDGILYDINLYIEDRRRQLSKIGRHAAMYETGPGKILKLGEVMRTIPLQESARLSGPPTTDQSIPKRGIRFRYGNTYVHKRYGHCRFIHPHPDDGACFIMIRWDFDEDEEVIFTCEPSDLVEPHANDPIHILNRTLKPGESKVTHRFEGDTVRTPNLDPSRIVSSRHLRDVEAAEHLQPGFGMKVQYPDAVTNPVDNPIDRTGAIPSPDVHRTSFCEDCNRGKYQDHDPSCPQRISHRASLEAMLSEPHLQALYAGRGGGKSFLSRKFNLHIFGDGAKTYDVIGLIEAIRLIGGDMTDVGIFLNLNVGNTYTADRPNISFNIQRLS